MLLALCKYVRPEKESPPTLQKARGLHNGSIAADNAQLFQGKFQSLYVPEISGKAATGPGGAIAPHQSWSLNGSKWSYFQARAKQQGRDDCKGIRVM